MRVFLGIDGGATHSRAAVVDERGERLGETEGGPLNFYALPDEQVRAHLKELLAWACPNGAGGTSLAGTVIGSAAVLEEARPDEIARLCQGLLDPARAVVVSDGLTALYGASAGGPGFLAISGTGSVVMGRDVRGEFHRVGGWGHVFGDAGSAYDVAVQALKGASVAVDGGRSTPVLEVVCQWLGVSDFVDALPEIYGKTMDKRRLAGLSAHLFERCEGCREIEALFLEAARNSAGQVRRLIGRGDFTSEGRLSLHVAGGMLDRNACVREALLRELADQPIDLRPAAHPAHWGAAFWARERFAGEL